MGETAKKLVGIVVAMQEEAECIIKELDLVKKPDVSGNKMYTGKYDGNFILLMISGIGKVNAQLAASILINTGCDLIINIGTCGAVKDINVGEVVLPNMFFDGDFDLSVLNDSTKDPAHVNERWYYSIPENPVSCATFSRFVTEKIEIGSILDMEAYSLVAQCRVYNIPVIIIKVVSDGADSNSTESFKNHVNSIVSNGLDILKKSVVDTNSVINIIYKAIDIEKSPIVIPEYKEQEWD